jgi:hypothetical protein
MIIEFIYFYIIINGLNSYDICLIEATLYLLIKDYFIFYFIIKNMTVERIEITQFQ